MKSRNIAQRYAISFYCKPDKILLITYGNLQKAFGNEVMSRVQVFCWHKMYCEGGTSVEIKFIVDDYQPHGQMSTLPLCVKSYYPIKDYRCK